MKKNLAILTLASVLSTSISPLALAQDFCFEGNCKFSTQHNVTMNAHSAEDLNETVIVTSAGGAAMTWFTYVGGWSRLLSGAKWVGSGLRTALPYVANVKVAGGLGAVAAVYGVVRAYQTYSSTGTWGDWSGRVSQVVSADGVWAYNGISNGVYQAASYVYHVFVDPLPASLRDRSGLTVENFRNNKMTALVSFAATTGVLATATAVVNTVRGFFVVSTAKLLEQAEQKLATGKAAVEGANAVATQRDLFLNELHLMTPQLQDLQAAHDDVVERVSTLIDGDGMKVITQAWIAQNPAAAQDVYMIQNGQIVAIRKSMIDSAAPRIIEWFMELSTDDVNALFPAPQAAPVPNGNPAAQPLVAAVVQGANQMVVAALGDGAPADGNTVEQPAPLAEVAQAAQSGIMQGIRAGISAFFTSPKAASTVKNVATAVAGQLSDDEDDDFVLVDE